MQLKSIFSKIGLGLLAVMFVASLGLAVTPDNALAQSGIEDEPTSGGGGSLEGPGGIPKDSDLSTVEGVFGLVQSVVQWLLIFAVVIGVIFIIVGGIKYVTAGGDSEQATQATRMIAFAAVGIAIILLAFILVQLVANIVGVEVPGKVLE